ncbi:MAG: hypothetical protein ABFR19_05640 [Pseudomonadota bacterium]
MKHYFISALVISLLALSSHAAAADSLFSYVPDETIYLYSNSRPLPNDFYDEQVRQARKIVTLSFQQMEADPTAAANLGKSKAGKFARELLLEVMQNAETDKLSNIGFNRESRSIIYSLGLTPVMRVGIESQDAVILMLKRVEMRAGFELGLTSCDGIPCVVVADDKEQLGVAVVIHKGHLAASLFQNRYRDKVVQHLTGKNMPEKSYPEKQFTDFVQSNGYSGYGEGFFRLQQGMENLQNVLTATTKQEGGDIDQLQKCFQVANAVVAHAPEIIMGVKSIQGRTINLEAVLRTSPAISKALMAIPAPLQTLQVSANPMLDFGFSANVPKLRDSLLAFMAFLGNSGEKAGCKAIQKKAMDEASMGVAMAMGMGITQVKTLYAALDDIQLGKNGQTEKASGRFSLVADDPMGLVRMLSMFAPPLASIQVPDDGTPVPLPEGLLPAGSPGVNLSLKGQHLDIVMGDGKAATAAMDTSKPVFFWFTTDGPRYHSILANLIQSTPPSEEMSAEQQQAALEMMEMMGKYQPWMSQVVYPDERGVVVDITARYP